ncbi:hypothetical protein K505DRAFT_326317 [Melanomma pulvis-pyrius CBS 109.77]|uniref:Uncharacterized protein n=1 Tax=Melanomma pulvis-pyrius CBS 109.77 TaxID=1314802 RepID=A0A6A6X8B8_9PLEO|nr:hypothetical protein K505DRAFT_326317 [Melanomma pulvis-pyrius CBS 109.77]
MHTTPHHQESTKAYKTDVTTPPPALAPTQNQTPDPNPRPLHNPAPGPHARHPSSRRSDPPPSLNPEET